MTDSSIFTAGIFVFIMTGVWIALTLYAAVGGFGIDAEGEHPGESAKRR